MDLLQILKQLKKIEPDQNYSRTSKMAILGHQITPKKTWQDLVWPTVRFGAGAALTTILIILIFVGFSKFSPMEDIDMLTLRAEAEAIDIQIQLTGLAYDRPLELINQTTTRALSESKTTSKTKTDVSNPDNKPKEDAKTEEVLEQVSINQALQELIK